MQTRLIIFLLFVTVLLTGCFSSNPDDIRAFLKPRETETTMNNYILEPPDEIQTSCSKVPAIDNQRQRIRPDGKISLEGIGEIKAVGKTPAELAEEIRLKVIQFYKLNTENPVDVKISVYQSKFYYVLGQVNSSGPKLCTGRDTISKAIGKAKPNLLARIKRIQIIRPSSDKNIRPAVFELNYDRMMAHGDDTKDVLLQEGDIIYVPPTIFGLIAMKVDEFVNIMQIRQKITSIHLVSTIWFILCAGYVLGIALLQAGVKWWIIFSLSIHGILAALFLTSLYLFAIFRGISSSQKLYVEHPITKTDQYALFYAATPFLGGLAGFLGMINAERIGQYISGITLGTLATTFLVWVIIDPVLGLLEMLLPESRKHYIKRQIKTKIVKEKKQNERQRLLAEALEQKNSDFQYWHEMLKPQAEKLASLLLSNIDDPKKAEQEAAGIGVNAWRIGGLSCMKELRNMAMDICRQNKKNRDVVDYITFWWDGIGGWRNTSFS